MDLKDLAYALGAQARLEDPPDAVVTLGEELALRRKLATDRDGKRDLASCLENVARACEATGQRSEALAAQREATALRRALVEG